MSSAQIIYDMPEAEYHQSSGVGEGKFITRSMIVDMINDAPSFFQKHIVKHPLMQFDGNDGTRFGNYFESYLLDRDVSQYVVKPTQCWSKSKSAVVDWNLRGSQFVLDASGEPTSVDTKTWESMNPNTVDEEQVELAKFMEVRFGETALGKWWVNKIPESKKQVVVRWTDETTGLNLQIRLDNYLEGAFACDLKSTASKLEKFSDTAHRYGYHVQDAMYSDGIELIEGKKIPFLFAVGETADLKRARIVTLHPVQVDYARKAYKTALAKIAAQDYAADGATLTEPEQCELPAYLLYCYENES